MTDELPHTIDAVVVGAGQAGLIMSRQLQLAGRDHVVLERRETLGGGWQDRWDGFTLVSPNWTTAFPGFPYDERDPDAFMPRDAVAGRVRRYAEVIRAPVNRSTEVQRLTVPGGRGRRFHLETTRGPIESDEVIVATGSFQVPRIPAAAAGLSPRVLQIHSHGYRRPSDLPPGGVLIVGSGQTGVQLAEELRGAGRAVVLSVGRCGRAPRRFRGYDSFFWLRQLATRGPAFDTPLPAVHQLPEPRARLVCNPHLSGHDGGHDTNLRRLAADGIRLAGRFMAAAGERVTFAADLATSLQFADTFYDERFRPLVEQFAERAGIELAEDDRAWPDYQPPELTELDLAAEDISSVLWTTGYAPDYGWLELPIFDPFGLPRQARGVSEVPGLSFIGLLWQTNQASANLVGVDVDAEYLASRWA
jgi:putative flavoprotein involved in K+ transport